MNRARWMKNWLRFVGQNCRQNLKNEQVLENGTHLCHFGSHNGYGEDDGTDPIGRL